MMNLDELKQILEMVREHELAEFELEQEGVKLRLRKYAAPALAALPPALPIPAATPAVPGVASAPAGSATSAVVVGERADAEESAGCAIVTSPIVGTFYRASAPDAPPFVELGSRVKKGQSLCIIEAMKLMNEIESEYEGEVVRVFVENGQPVQYGDRLFAVKLG